MRRLKWHLSLLATVDARAQVGVKVLFLTCNALVFNPSQAQEIPRIINFSKDQYQARNQNWSITQTPELLMLFGNSAGLLEFNGSMWATWPLPHQQTVRAVACDAKGTIFTGAFGEFGYWTRQNNQLTYHSLSAGLSDGIANREEFWHIFIKNDLVFFQSFSVIYCFDYQQVRRLAPPGNIMFMQQIGERLLLPVIGRGIFELQHNNGFEFVSGSEMLADKAIVCLLPFGKDGFLAGTANDGIFEYDGERFQSWSSEAQKVLKINQLNKGIRLRDGRFAFGTILNGVYIVSAEGRLLHHINQRNGLQNNTVLALHEDRAHNLWIGLDKGIDLLELSSPLTLFRDKNGVVGTVYAAVLFDNQLFVGSNQGVFVRPWPTQPATEMPFRLIPGTQGQVWQLQVFDNQMIIGHNNGTFCLEQGGKLHKISDVTGGWVTLRHPRQPDVLLQGTYTGLTIFRKDKQGRWGLAHRIAGFNEPIKKMVFDEAGYVWVVNPNRGLYRLQLDAALENIQSLYAFSQADGLSSEYKIDLKQVNDRILIKSGATFLVFNSQTLRLEPAADMPYLTAPDNQHFELKQGLHDDYFQIYNDKVAVWSAGQRTVFNLSLAPDFESIMLLDSHTYLLGMDDGYALLNREPLANAAVHLRPPPLLITGVQVFDPRRRDTSFVATPSGLRFVARQNNIRFYFSQPVFVQPPRYSFMLVGYPGDEWSEWQSQSFKEYNRLPPGTYTFRVRSNLTKEIAELNFIIRTHWYQTWWAALLYMIVLVAAMWLVERWNRRRLENQRIKLEQEKEKQLEEQRIKAVNERLQLDIISKSKELANSTMSLVQKNEILLKIKEEIQSLRAASDGKVLGKQYQRLLHLIDTNISSEQDWQVFETNFNQVHESFFKKLKAEFPDLTPGDLKLAAYLKMNLSSKEIAPLLNISIRSVENKRYRLRKKLHLAEEDNLMDFMLQY